MEENYSIQAKNLLENLVDEYKNLINEIHKIDILLKQVKGVRVELNKRTRWISEVSNITKDIANKKIKILIYNEEYLPQVKEQLDNLNLKSNKNGQFIDIPQPNFTYSDLMQLVDELETKKNKLLSKCSKAKMDPVVRSKHALENDFIDQAVARKTSNNCQRMFQETEEVVKQMTLKKIKSILGNEYYKKFLREEMFD